MQNTSDRGVKMVGGVAEVELAAAPEYAACQVVGGSIVAKFPAEINR